tara:strand:- start:71 stop:292 length:222 start_codon:yes stop_codon:yes gene_type:complete
MWTLHSVRFDESKIETKGGLNKPNWIISTSKLNALQHLHIWPINLVVYQDPWGDLILGGAWRLDAFSAYLFRA